MYMYMCMCMYVHIGAVEQLARGCPRLVSLNMMLTAVTDAGAALLATGCTALTYVNLDGTRVSDVGLDAIARSCEGWHDRERYLLPESTRQFLAEHGRLPQASDSDSDLPEGPVGEGQVRPATAG